MMNIKEVLTLMVYTFSDKKASVGAIKSEIMSNYEIAEELHKSVIRRFENWKLKSIFYRQYLGCWFCQYAINKKI